MRSIWEYKSVEFYNDEESYQEVMKDAGTSSWEAYAITISEAGSGFIEVHFKREAYPDPKEDRTVLNEDWSRGL